MREKYLFIDQPLSQLKADIQNEKKDVFRRLYQLARVYKEAELPDEHPNKSTTYMGFASMNLSLLYILTGQKEYLTEAKRWIFTCVKYPHWGSPLHKSGIDVDLSAAFMLFGLSLSYDWLKDDLSDAERTQLEEKLYLQSNRMFEHKLKNEGKGWPTAYYQNHNWIDMASLATVGYALKDKYPELEKQIVNAKENFDLVMDYMPNDGSDYEGAVYWRYGIIWLYIYAHLTKTEGDHDFFKSSDFLRETFFYRLYQAVPNLEEIVNYGDCHDKKSSHSLAVYRKMAAEYNNEYAQNLADIVANNFVYREQYESKIKPGILPETGLELLWYNPKVKSKSFEDLPLVKYFDDLGLVVLRDSWKEDAFLYSFKCGMPGGKKQFKQGFEILKERGYKVFGLSHQHPDNTAFLLHANDTYHSIDEGYNRSVKAREHNVVTVGDVGYFGEGDNIANVFRDMTEEHTAETKNFTQEGNVTYFVGSTPKMYHPSVELTQYDRHIFYTGRNYVFSIDELASNLEHNYKYHLHTEVLPDDDGKMNFVYENGPGKMKFTMNSTEKLAFEHTYTYVKAIMTTQEPDVFRAVNMNTLNVINEKKSKTANFITIMKTDDIFNEESCEITQINEGLATGISIKGSDYHDILLYSTTNVEYDGKKYDSKFVLIQKNASGDVVFIPKK